MEVHQWGSEGESEVEVCVCVFFEMKRNESCPSIASQEGDILREMSGWELRG